MSNPNLLALQSEIVTLECELRTLSKKRLPPKRIKKAQQQVQRLKTLHTELLQDQNYQPVSFQWTNIQSQDEETAVIDVLRQKIKRMESLLKTTHQIAAWASDLQKPTMAWKVYWRLSKVKRTLNQIERDQENLRQLKGQWLQFVQELQKSLPIDTTDNPFAILKALAKLQDEINELKHTIAEDERELGKAMWEQSMQREALENQELMRLHKLLPGKALNQGGRPRA